MKWTDEDLMAHADGEGDAGRRAALDAALAADAGLRRRCDAFVAQRARVAAAFAPVLGEAVPDRLAELLRPTPVAVPSAAPAVVDLAAERARRRLGWAAWGGMAACLALGVLLGLRLGGADGADDAGLGLARDRGQLVAAGPLADALDRRLAAEPAPDGIVLPLSFVDRDGRHCRAFAQPGLAGLACRAQGRWTVETLAAAEPPAAGAMRPAATPLPRTVLEAVDARIADGPLDASAERRARDAGW